MNTHTQSWQELASGPGFIERSKTVASGAERPVMPSVFFLSSFSLDYTLCLLCSFCACAPAMFRNLIWGGVANMQSSLDSVSLGRHPYPVRSFVNLREKGWKDGDGEGKIREKKPAVEKLNASVLWFFLSSLSPTYTLTLFPPTLCYIVTLSFSTSFLFILIFILNITHML